MKNSNLSSFVFICMICMMMLLLNIDVNAVSITEDDSNPKQDYGSFFDNDEKEKDDRKENREDKDKNDNDKAENGKGNGPKPGHPNFWTKYGNKPGQDHFLGTVDDSPLNFRTNNIEQMTILPSGNIFMNQNLLINGFLTAGSLAGSGSGLLRANDTGTVSRFDFTGNPNDVLRGDGTFGSFYDADWEVDGTNMFSIPTGNVGIGTTTPEAKLDVNGRVIAKSMRLTELAGGDGMVVVDSMGNLYMKSFENDTIVLKNIKITDALQIGTQSLKLTGKSVDEATGESYDNTIFSSDGDLYIQCSDNSYNTILNTINNTGNVGIGTDEPAGKIEIIGNKSYLSTGGHFLLENNLNGTGGTMFLEGGSAFSNGGDIEIKGGSGGDAKGGDITIEAGFGGSEGGNVIIKSGFGGHIKGGNIFLIPEEAGTFNEDNKGRILIGEDINNINTEILRSGDIYTKGKIGIGTDYAEAKLDVNGDLKYNGDLFNGEQKINFDIWRENENNNYYHTLGDIGIGTQNPQYKLDVNGDVNFDGSLYKNGEILSILTAPKSDGGDIMENATEVSAPPLPGGLEPTTLFRFAYDLGSVYEIEKIKLKWDEAVDGHSLIPNYTIQVSNKNTYDSYTTIYSNNEDECGYVTGSTSNVIEFDEPIKGRYIMVRYIFDRTECSSPVIPNLGDIHAFEKLDDGTFDDMLVRGNLYSHPLYVKNNNVGIGNDDPAKKLDVRGHVNIEGDLYQRGEKIDLAKVSLWDKNGSKVYRADGKISIGDRLDYMFSKFNVFAEGDIETSPTNNNHCISILGTGNQGMIFGVDSDAGEDGRSYIHSYKWAKGRRPLILNPSGGKVGIGTGTTDMRGDHKLYVNGNIIAHKVYIKTTGNWPDHVFDKDYSLIELSDVENFINKNKHLPGVPSQAEIKENGFEMAEMDAILLKKIEELTLYMIELKKENEALKKENEKIKAIMKRVEEIEDMIGK